MVSRPSSPPAGHGSKQSPRQTRISMRRRSNTDYGPNVFFRAADRNGDATR
jgi:hypothetical protein